MNLSDLITAAPDTAKTNGPAADTPDSGDHLDNAEAAKLFGLALDLSNQDAALTSDAAAPKLVEPQGVAAETTSRLIVDGLGHRADSELAVADPEVEPIEPPVQEDLHELAPAPLAETPKLAPSMPHTAQVPPRPPEAAPKDDRNAGQPAAVTVRSSETQVQTVTNSTIAQPIAVHRTEAPASPIAEPVASPEPPRARLPEPSFPQPVAKPTIEHVATAPNSVGVTAEIAASQVSPRQPVKSVDPAPSIRRHGTAPIIDRDTPVLKTPEPVRAAPDLIATLQSTASTSEPRLIQFLAAQGALQPLAGEAPVLGPSSGAPTSLTITAGNFAGALASEMPSQTVQRAVLPQIVNSLQTQVSGVIDLMLDPPELGRIEILIELSDKSLRATLSADRTGTGDLIRRHADDLLQQFSDAGFGDVDLNFANRDGDTQRDDRLWAFSDQGSDQESGGTDDARSAIMIRADGRVDLRL
ncbi:MAG: flagellar hook-length control protein FliK [Pseudomonadota bacterium]